MIKNESLKKIIREIKFKFNLKQSEIADKLGVKSTYLSDMINGRVPFTENISEKIYELFYIRIDKSILQEPSVPYEKAEPIKQKSNLIPFYDDAASIGGTNQVANMQGISQPTEYIDTGDWFKDATAAMRHYGESMVEYPAGCILAIKEVYDKNLIVWGRDYVIETSEYRVTKRVQRGIKDGYVLACSTNEETYKNGSLIHEPLDVFIDSARFFLVLGYVVKKNGGTMVLNK